MATENGAGMDTSLPTFEEATGSYVVQYRPTPVTSTPASRYRALDGIEEPLPTFEEATGSYVVENRPTPAAPIRSSPDREIDMKERCRKIWTKVLVFIALIFIGLLFIWGVFVGFTYVLVQPKSLSEFTLPMFMYLASMVVVLLIFAFIIIPCLVLYGWLMTLLQRRD
ncbi:uncharacterized protein LOC106654420 [Trichogramma pretiosum]|uniref:uncharacterized protein LOC106654420 n=1 Tax=Trichogramma pretiosum TaxID=7493 RepID=UPI0006C9C2F1|nr:uncharacterized protein LOC106654420 [Trichogramma pretiosum]